MNKTIILKADWKDVEGTIKVSEYFDSAPDIVKLDLLKDWMYFLQKKYDEVHIHLWPNRNPPVEE